jgi:hypothetical protein
VSLTKPEVEDWRTELLGKHDYRHNLDSINALCDMALRTTDAHSREQQGDEGHSVAALSFGSTELRASLERWNNASDESLYVIERNECPPDPFSLCTKRFRRLFNEIATLRDALKTARSPNKQTVAGEQQSDASEIARLTAELEEALACAKLYAERYHLSEASLKQAESRLERAEQDAKARALDAVRQNRRHVELSPGVGADVQRYALAVLDDVTAAIDQALGSKE